MTKEEKQPKAKTPEELQAALQDNLDQFPEITGEEPYLADAKSFLTQALACLGKQIKTNV